MPRRASLANCLRMVFMAVLLLGLCLQPVFAAMGEAHEAVAHAAGAAAHAHVDVDGVDGDSDPTGSDGTTLHGLMHFAHCCGQASTVLPPGLPKLASQPFLRMPGGDVASLPLAKRLSLHDRPPISN